MDFCSNTVFTLHMGMEGGGGGGVCTLRMGMEGGGGGSN